MSRTGLLQLLALFGALVSHSVSAQFTCPDNFTGCDCELINDYAQLQCTHEGEKEGISYHHYLKIEPEEYVGIKCGGRNHSWDYFLNEKILDGVDPIKSMTFENCWPLSAQDFRLVSERLGLKHNIQQLTYEHLPRKLQYSDLDFFIDLKSLNLAQNNLNDINVDLIWGLTNLTELYLRQTYITLPLGFFNHSKKLQFVELSFNDIKQLEPGTFDGLESIQVITLWANSIKELHRSVFRNLSTLWKLDLNRNQLNELPADVFMELPELQKLDLSSNNMTTLPKDIFRYNKYLHSLKMSYNDANMELPNGLLANLTFLADVELKYDGLTSVPEDLLWNSTLLESLDLSYNYLTVLPPFLLKDAINLKKLNLEYNDLTDIPEGFFLNTVELTTLDLSFNEFAFIKQTTIKFLQKLEFLNMENNNLSFIHQDAFVTNTKLKTVKFADNHLTMLTGIHDFSGPLSPLRHNKYLEEIDLANNVVSEIFGDWIFNLKMLRKLTLQNNMISELQSKDLQFMSKNIIINLQQNKVKTVNLNELEQLALDYYKTSIVERKVKVILNNNPFVCDCQLYSLLRYLKKKMKPEVYNYVDLNLYGAKCSGPKYVNGTSLNDFVINNFQCRPKRLFRLFNDSCEPNGSCDCWFKPSISLLSMNCSARSLTSPPEFIDVRNTNSVALDLRYNQLVKQPDMTKWGYKYVTSLLLEGNMIETVDESLITLNLAYLELKNNRLTYLDSAFLNKIKNGNSLLGLTLSKNPWRCDCNAKPLHSFVQTHAAKFPDLFNITCANHTDALVKFTQMDLCPHLYQIILGIAIGFAVMFLLSTMFVIVYFHYKLPIKIWLYSHNFCLCCITEQQVDKNRVYDAFISYSHMDEKFVKDELLAKLEAKPYPYNICIHERDWIAGEWIPAQIQRSVDESKRTIIVLSHNFIKSLWSKIEFQEAHIKAVEENRCRLIVILLDDIEDKIDLMCPELAQYLKMHTYIKWGDPWFWQKLAYALPHRNKSTLEAIRRENKEFERIEVIMNNSSLNLSKNTMCCYEKKANREG